MTGDARTIPVPSLRRLPAYRDRLRQALDQGQESLSCAVIAADLNLTDTQVRKDLALTGVTGTPRLGYPVKQTIAAIEAFLGWKNSSDAFLIGAGSLGTSILGYQAFSEHGLNIVAAFDVDPLRIGRSIHGRSVLDLKKLPGLVRRMGVNIAVLTTPGEVAGPVAHGLAAAGIRAIWNFTPSTLNLGPDVVVEDVRLYASLASLTARLRALLAG